MSSTLLALVAIAYTYVAWDYVSQERWGMAMAFAAYAIANIGFLIDLR